VTTCMDSTTLLWIFLGVWGGLLLLYCIFKVCGGRIADCFSCECCSGPCADCWGNGGQIDAYDREYPFARGMLQPARGRSSSLPPIVIVNKTGDDDDDSDDSDDGDNGDNGDNGDGRRVSQRSRRWAEEFANESDSLDGASENVNNALLLRSRSKADDLFQKNRKDPVVVV
jgi:hypothetical protein